MAAALIRPQSFRASTTQGLLRIGNNQTCQRYSQQRAPVKPVPSPTPFVPDAATFLKLIGRGLSQHAAKITSWDALFNLSSEQLAKVGIENPRQRRYLLQWRERFRYGQWGMGGDLKYVTDGVGKVKICEIPSKLLVSASEQQLASQRSQEQAESVPVVEETVLTSGKEALAANETEAPSAVEQLVPRPAKPRASDRATMTRTPGMTRIALNMPEELTDTNNISEIVRQLSEGKLKTVAGVGIKNGEQLYGSCLQILPNSESRLGAISAQEGLWEIKRGVKVDGGERRKAEVRAKRRAAERKAQRS